MENGKGSRGKLTRQLSKRLQMQAPSSIQVDSTAAASSMADWKAAIPLLSPLDIVSLPNHRRDTWLPMVDEKKEEERAIKWSTWQQQSSIMTASRQAPVFL